MPVENPKGSSLIHYTSSWQKQDFWGASSALRGEESAEKPLFRVCAKCGQKVHELLRKFGTTHRKFNFLGRTKQESAFVCAVCVFPFFLLFPLLAWHHYVMWREQVPNYLSHVARSYEERQIFLPTAQETNKTADSPPNRNAYRKMRAV